MPSRLLKLNVFWAGLVLHTLFDRVERATGDLLWRAGVRAPRNSGMFTTALRSSTYCESAISKFTFAI